MKKKTLRMLAWLLAIVMMFSAASVSVMAAPEDNQNSASASDSTAATDTVDKLVEGSGSDYVSYQNSNAGVPAAKEDIAIPAINYTSENGSGVKVGEKFGKKDVLLWESRNGSVTYTFDIPEEAVYNIEFEYGLLDSSERDLDFGIQIDGKFPFDEASALELPRMWMDATDFRTDDVGNQFAPEQISYEGYVTKAAFDASGASVYPMEFKFTKGTHTVTILNNDSESIAISKVCLAVPESSAPTYAEVSAQYKANGYKSVAAEPIVIEGERADIKSTRSLVPYADNSSNLVTPSSPTLSQINYIGGVNWEMPNQEIVWNINVPADGLYNLGILFKQDLVVNGFSYRHLRIDGETPFKECATLQFNYKTGWQTFEFGNGEELYDFYLTKGTHTLSLTGTMGNLASSYYKLKNITSEIGSFYIEVVMITSESPDRNRDYELFRTVPDFENRLLNFSTELTSLVDEMKRLSGEKGSSYIAAINNMVRVIDSMRKEKYESHLYVSDFYTQYTTLSSWLYEMQAMSVSIDQMQIIPAGSEFKFKESNFFANLSFGCRRFLASFDESYSRVSVLKGGAKTIKIWVNWGRDQAQVLNNLINESFVPYAEKELGYSVSVNLELVNADIIKGMLSGNAPDLSLHLARSTPVNLALRGALVDLTQFPDYKDILPRFGSTASIPYEYNGGVYALPDQQSFYMMFYRHDIFEQLGIDVPQTWDEYLAVTAVLQRNNMNSYLPYTKISNAATVNTGVGGLNLFCSVLMQHGEDGQLYNAERNRCMMDSPTSLQAFTYWTDMYTKYKIPTEASFYNRFRVGTMPLGIMAYTQYTTLAEAAPEIAGRWSIALIPGVKDENGNINRTISGSGTGCSILATSKNQTEAWTFLKWWTSAEVQSRYNTNVESLIGTISRITTANLKAFEDMAWERDDLKILLAQRDWIVEVPEVPGSYYVSRSVDQAFWSVVNKDSTPKDSLTKWTLEANNEIKRKIAEYS
ncbi:MAG: extracellular solute-binding protein [Clostridia bacterium]|nr:extracellular solute-binding protein [Clostridia bacterium]